MFFGKSETNEGKPKGEQPVQEGPYQFMDPEEGEEDEGNALNLFEDEKVRAKFVRKVYMILTTQLLFTFFFVLPFLFLDSVQEFVYDHPQLFYVCVAITIIPYFTLVCCESIRRSFPKNLILLVIMTLGMSCVCGYLTAKMNTDLVFYAILLTVLVTVSITLLAIFCPIDFTKYYMLLCVGVLVLCIFAAIAAAIFIVTDSKAMNIIYASIVVVIFSLFLLFDTQAIVGGKRVSLSPEEYILGAIQLYVDIVEIFLNFLEIIGTCAEGD